MRTFRRAGVAPVAVFLFAITAPGASTPGVWAQTVSTNPDQTGVAPSYPPAPEANPLRGLAELRSKLDRKDHMIALRALHLALTRVPDGGTFLWQKRSRLLKGMIKPSKAFRNADGQVCRHIIYALALGRYLKQIEGIACRQNDGRWQL